MEPGEYYFEVSADRGWSVTAKQVGHLAQHEGPLTFSGSGPSVTPVFLLREERFDVHATHQGNGHFGVIIFNASTEQVGGLLVNMVGSADTTLSERADAGPHLIEVSADGA